MTEETGSTPNGIPPACTPKEAPLFVGPEGVFGLFAGYFPFLYGLVPLIGLLEGNVSAGELALGCVALGVGGYGIVWDRKRVRRSKRLRAAIDAAIPDEDRIAEDQVLPTLARAFSGAVVPATPQGLMDSLRDPEQGRAPERHERVCVTRDGVELTIYLKSFHASSGEFDDRGPGMIHLLAYWRVQARVATEVEFRLSPREMAEPFSFRWDPVWKPGPRTFEALFQVEDPSGWVRTQLPAEVRALLLQRTAFVVRCTHGRVECMWPQTVVGVTRSRFEDAARIVSMVARQLGAGTASQRDVGT
ncbi:hypothetical protein D7Y21_07505 [Corallococcus sp. AB045]|uniref:hypothetical protein n=1 Tax=Corallococcus sp. AB045 TaxID=2316719 RepID=UPI000ECE2946|nr:hypothetical protein [Corallococcus sp. AB045]RKH90160.1 hypothetical protein D7Y21_07505 [Corallococcus sp. AB045]